MSHQHVSLKDKIKAHLPGHNKDANHNGVPDRLEHGTTSTHPVATTHHTTTVPVAAHGTTTTTTTVTGPDVNRNGIPDQLERGSTLPVSQDLNRNGVPDSLERGSTLPVSQDLNRNGVPDSLERGSTLPVSQDLNRNGIPDSMERTTVTGLDLNRNGIPDQLEGQQGFGFIGSTQVNTTSVVDVREAPVVVERVEKAAVVHEVLKTEEVVQIQPVIEREREKLDVYEVVQPMKEREVMATEVRQAVLPAQTRATVVEDNSAFLAQRSAPSDVSTREVAATLTQTVTNAPIVHETVVHRVVEEIQPVIYKEIDRPILVKETLPIYEKIVEAPHAHHSVLPVRDLGVHTTGTGVATAQMTTTTTTTVTGPDRNGNGIPDQLEGRMANTNLNNNF